MLFGKLINEKVQLKERVKALEERLALTQAYLNDLAKGNFKESIHAIESSTSEEKHALLSTMTLVSQRLSEYAEKESEQQWIAEGMSRFMDLISGNNRERDDFFDMLLKLLVQYTAANQGGIFLLNDDNHQDTFLELTSCYAYNKKKYAERRVDIGQGLLGQCFLENETMFLSEVPNNYTSITSGLGEATPRFLVLVPLRFDQRVLGVIELAYFTKPQPFKVGFIERFADNVASLIINIKTAKQVKHLFEESEEKAKILQEQEETLRQNVEELVATQEEMKRHQDEINRQSSLMKLIIDNIPFPIFVKDERGRYSLVNVAESHLFNLSDQELIGKDDSHFVTNLQEWEVIKNSDQKVLKSDEPVELPLQHFTTSTGNAYIFKTTKIPFVNPVTGKKNILGVSIDLTEKLKLEEDLQQEKRQREMHAMINLTARQRMLSQKIAYYCEMLVRGKKKKMRALQEAVDLFDESLNVIRNGGFPSGITLEAPLQPIHTTLIPHVIDIENAWSVYKGAAEKIMQLNLHLNNSVNDLEEAIDVIEDNSELVLELTNNLLNALVGTTNVNIAQEYQL